MKITIIVEGKTESAFLPSLRAFIQKHLPNSMPRLVAHRYDGRIPKGDELKRVVDRLLNDGNFSADHVIALTDVYTGTNPADFKDAADAISKMRSWVGPEPRFHPHAAQHDFEAWLLPYWKTVQQLADHNRTAPQGKPESVNHVKSPAYHIAEIFKIGASGRSYVKARDGIRILKNNDLSTAVNACPQLKSLINTIITVSGGTPIP